MVKCEECGSSLIFTDAEKDLIFCKSCGHVEGVDYKEITEDIYKNYLEIIKDETI